eukprot:350886_1
MDNVFKRVPLADQYTRDIVFGYIRAVANSMETLIPSIIIELCVAMYYQGEHFAYLGDEMYLDSVDTMRSESSDYRSRLSNGTFFNNIVVMTSDSAWNTVYGQIEIKNNTKNEYIYEWIIQIISSPTIGIGIASDYDKTDDAVWHSPHFSTSFYMLYKYLKGCVFSSQKIECGFGKYESITFEKGDQISLILNVKEQILQYKRNETDESVKKKIILEKNKSYHLAISLGCTNSVQLMEFKRTKIKSTK